MGLARGETIRRIAELQNCRIAGRIEGNAGRNLKDCRKEFEGLQEGI
jgi:hypothetical protein